jgi:glutathione peroxidase-family protein
MFSKINVNGPQTHDVYQWLKRNSLLFNPKDNTTKDISWNFGKFLINGNGNVVDYFHPDKGVQEMLPTVLELLK